MTDHFVVYRRRKHEFYREVLDKFLQTIELAIKYKLVKEEWFSSDCEMPFGCNYESVQCYALKLEMIYPKDGGGLLQAVNEQCTGHEFDYTKSVVESAVKEYKSPYGRFAWLNAPYRFKGDKQGKHLLPSEHFEKEYSKLLKEQQHRLNEEEINRQETRLAKLKQRIFPVRKVEQLVDTVLLRKRAYVFPEYDREVLIISKLIYTWEEKERRGQESKESVDVFAHHVTSFNEWLETKNGDYEMNRVVDERMNLHSEQYNTAQEDLKEATKHLKRAKKLWEIYKTDTVEGEEEDEQLVELKQAQEQVQRLVERVKQVKVLKGKRSKWWYDSSMSLAREHLTVLVEEKMLEIRRKDALRRNLRRPWDGVLGRDFQMWKVSWHRKYFGTHQLELLSCESPSDLVKQLRVSYPSIMEAVIQSSDD